MNEEWVFTVAIEKTRRRIIAEALLYFWGVFGFLGCLFLIYKAAQIQSVVSAAPQLSGISAAVSLQVVGHAVIWAGGVIFLGFFAMCAPVKMTWHRAH